MSWKVPLFDLSIGEEESQAVSKVIESKWISMGEVTKEFEREFSKRHDARHGIAICNCTAALHLALKALGIDRGDEVICPSLTFAATGNSILYVGARPVFSEITSADDLTISTEDVENRITGKTKAIVVVHYGGWPCEMDRILDIARKYDLRVIEDAAHSPFAEYDGKKVGTIGDVGCFSFFSNKNMTTSEGGMVITNDDVLSEKIRLMRSHGMTAISFDRFKGHASSYDVVELGYNYRIDDIRSSMGLVQFRKLKSFNEERRRLTNLYLERLLGLDEIIVPFRHLMEDNPSRLSSFHIFPVLVNTNKTERHAIREKLAEKGVQTSVHYQPIHLFKIYRERFGYKKGYLPLTEWVASHEITLPLFPGMTDEDVSYVSESLKQSI
ncbi:MAG: DegT/DnrJ/EryC1/StrS family aminotransferase [Thermodesulfobacteriota bacterium]